MCPRAARGCWAADVIFGPLGVLRLRQVHLGADP